MKKYLYFRIHLYYIIAGFFFALMPFVVVLRDVFFPLVEDKAMWSQLMGFFYTLILIFLFVVAVVPALIGFKMKRSGKEWCNDITNRDKSAGFSRKLLMINVVLFAIANVASVVISKMNTGVLFADFFWVPLVIFPMWFALCAVMTGVGRTMKAQLKG